MPTLGPVELIIILVIVVVLFGASRLRGIGGALGGSIKEFKTAVRDEQTTTPPTVVSTTPPAIPSESNDRKV